MSPGSEYGQPDNLSSPRNWKINKQIMKEMAVVTLGKDNFNKEINESGFLKEKYVHPKFRTFEQSLQLRKGKQFIQEGNKLIISALNSQR